MLGLGRGAAQVFISHDQEEEAAAGGPEQPPGAPARRWLAWEEQRLLSNAPQAAAGLAAPDGALAPLLPSIMPAARPPIAGDPLQQQQPPQQPLTLVDLPLGADGRRPMLMYISRTNCGW